MHKMYSLFTEKGRYAVWYDGRALKSKKITEYHWEKIGKVLADIHSIEKENAPFERNEIHIDWNFYIEKMKVENDELYRLMKDNCSLFYESQKKGNISIKKITASHNYLS